MSEPQTSEPLPSEPAVRTVAQLAAVLALSAALSTWWVDLAATQVALPSIQSTFGISVTTSQWVLNITFLVLAGAVTVGGVLGDRLGRLRIFRAGSAALLVGATTALGGGMLGNFGLLLAGRALIGLGAALAGPATTALLADLFPRQVRGTVQGRVVAMSALAAAVAPLAAGLIIQAFAWPYIYWMTITLATITLLLVRRVEVERNVPAATPFDYTGSILVFCAVALLISGIMLAGTRGWGAPAVLALVAAGLVGGGVLVATALRKPYPLIQFRLLQQRSVAVAVFVIFMRFLPQMLMGTFLARYAQQVMGFSPGITGLLLILPPLAQAAAAPVAGRMLDQGGPRRPVTLGIGLQLAGLLLLAVGFPAQAMAVVMVGAIVGVAGYAFVTPVQMAALNATQPAQRGMVAGLFPLAGQFGTALWVALLTAGLSNLMAAYLASNPGASAAAAQAQALGILAWMSSGLTLFSLAAARRLQASRAELP